MNQFKYDGDELRVQLVSTRRQKKFVTAPHTRERQKLLDDAATHGVIFSATGGDHLTSDDFFKSTEVPTKRKKVGDKERDKNDRLERLKIEQDAQAILALNKASDKFLDKKLETIVLWHGLKKTEMGKLALKKQKWELQIKVLLLFSLGLLKMKLNWRI